MYKSGCPTGATILMPRCYSERNDNNINAHRYIAQNTLNFLKALKRYSMRTSMNWMKFKKVWQYVAWVLRLMLKSYGSRVKAYNLSADGI